MSYLKILCSRNSILSAFKKYNPLLVVIINKNRRCNASTLSKLKSLLKREPKVRTIELDYELSKLKNDVLLYEYERQQYYTTLSVANICLIVYWCYLSVNLFNDFISDPDLTTNIHSLADFKKSVQENWDIYLKIICLEIGVVTVMMFWLLLSRRVRRIILRKGGKRVRITCYSAAGIPNLDRHYDMPLLNVSARTYRNEYPQSDSIPLRLKGQKYYFYVHQKGTFFNPLLYDATVGQFRQFD